MKATRGQRGATGPFPHLPTVSKFAALPASRIEASLPAAVELRRAVWSPKDAGLRTLRLLRSGRRFITLVVEDGSRFGSFWIRTPSACVLLRPHRQPRRTLVLEPSQSILTGRNRITA